MVAQRKTKAPLRKTKLTPKREPGRAAILRGLDRPKFNKGQAMKIRRRQFLRFAAAGVAVCYPPQIAWSQAYPTRPVRIVAGFAPGGGVDIAARLIGQSLSERLGQPFVIENRPGAGSNIGTESVVNAAPDGYTLLLVSAPNAINAALYEKLSFDFIRDIAPIASIHREPHVMVVHPSVPTDTVPEFLRYAKANPGKINMASAGNGSTNHVTGELFKMITGVALLHVPYRSASPALIDVIAGQVQVYFATMSSSIEYIRADKLRPLAVTSLTRSARLPDIPSVAEFVPGFEASQWYGVAAPRNTPAEIIDKLSTEINAAIADPKLKARIAGLGATPMPMTPADFRTFIAAETDKWGKVVKFSGAKVD
jgi:tripartite-type tricarboxylate transporter receptor subunit TctC